MSFGVTFSDLLEYGVTKSEIRTTWNSPAVRKNPSSGKFDSLILDAILELEDPTTDQITAFVMKRSSVPHQTAAKSMEWWRSRIGIVKRQIVYAWCGANSARTAEIVRLKTGQVGLKQLMADSTGAKLELVKELTGVINATVKELKLDPHNVRLSFNTSTNGELYYHVV